MARSPASRPDLKGSDARRRREGPPASEPHAPREGYRETVEAIVVAFILALLVRGFEAEAFVIPTGSMAPTLMGRHKEITCPQCGYVYAVNASEEVEGSSAGEPVVAAGVLGDLRQLPVPGPGRRRAELQGRPHPRDEVPLRPARCPARPGPSAGTWSSSATPRSPRSATSSGWSACPARRSRSGTATSSSSRPAARSSSQARKPLEHQQAMQMMVYDDAPPRRRR